MNRIQFFVPGMPRGKGRPRFYRSKAGHPVAVTPDETRDYEARIGFYARQASGGRMFERTAAVSLVIAAAMPIPASWSKRKQEAAAAGQMQHTGKPDIDNVLKAVMDGLNGAIWHDDVQVNTVTAERHYVLPGQEPGVSIFVERMEP